MGEPSTKSECLVVADVLETLANRFGIKEAETNQKLISKVKELEIEFSQKLQELVFDNISVRKIEASELSNKIFSEVRKIYKNSVIVCLDRSYFPNELHLHPTREYEGGIVAHHNLPSLDQQAGQIKNELEKRFLLRGGKETGVILVDVGISGGRTLIEVIPILKKKGIKIDGIVAGIVSTSGEERIKSESGYKVIGLEPKTWVEWIDARDLFLIDGMQIRGLARDGYKGKFMSLPDAVDQDRISNIRPEKKEDFRKLCVQANRRLFEILREFKIDTTVIGQPLGYRDRLVKDKVLRNL